MDRNASFSHNKPQIKLCSIKYEPETIISQKKPLIMIIVLCSVPTCTNLLHLYRNKSGTQPAFVKDYRRVEPGPPKQYFLGNESRTVRFVADSSFFRLERCGAVRCSAVRCGSVRCGMVWWGAVRCGKIAPNRTAPSKKPRTMQSVEIFQSGYQNKSV